MIDEFVRRVRETGALPVETVSRNHAAEEIRHATGSASWTRWNDPLLTEIALDGPAAPPDKAQVSIVVADIGVAESGSVVLVHGEGRGRASAVLPEVQIVLLRRRDIVATVETAFQALLEDADRRPSNAVIVTGPSRTSDIESKSIIGVHAPRKVYIVIRP